MRKLLWISLAVLAAAAVSCRKHEQDPEPGPGPVKEVTVQFTGLKVTPGVTDAALSGFPSAPYGRIDVRCALMSCRFVQKGVSLHPL